MRFPYTPFPTRRPVYPLGGIAVRHLPTRAIPVLGPSGDSAEHAPLDTGAGDTIFSERVAQALGLDLSHAPWGASNPVGGPALRYRYAPVTMRLSDGVETCVWQAIVGFLP